MQVDDRGFCYLWVLLVLLGMYSVGTGVWVVD